MFYENLIKNIDISILEGIVTFGNNEGRFCRELAIYYDKFQNIEDDFKQNEIIYQYLNSFEDFAKAFRIIRNIDSNTSNRYKLLNLVFREYLPTINKEYSPLSIDIYSERANQLGLTHGKATSAFSKIAFLYRPNLYFPFDKTARESLKDCITEKGMRINLERNYFNYSKIINMVFNEFNQLFNIKDYIISKEFLSKFNINRDLFAKSLNNLYTTCKLLGISDIDSFIYRRTFDKSLMIYGGFNVRNLVVYTDGIMK